MRMSRWRTGPWCAFVCFCLPWVCCPAPTSCLYLLFSANFVSHPDCFTYLQYTLLCLCLSVRESRFMCSFSSCFQLVLTIFLSKLLPFCESVWIACLPACSVDYLPAWTLTLIFVDYLWTTYLTIFILVCCGRVFLLNYCFLFPVFPHVPVSYYVFWGTVPGSLQINYKNKSMLGPTWVSFEHRHDTLETNFDKRMQKSKYEYKCSAELPDKMQKTVVRIAGPFANDMAASTCL